MSNISNQCASLELSRRLRKLRGNKRTAYEWVEYIPSKGNGNGRFDLCPSAGPGGLDIRISAPTASELLEELPEGTQVCKVGGFYSVLASLGMGGTIKFSADSLADALAKALIWHLGSEGGAK